MYTKILVGYDDSDRGKGCTRARKAARRGDQRRPGGGGVFQFDPVWGGADSRFRDADVEFASKIEAAAKGGRAEPEAVQAAHRRAGFTSSRRRSEQT